MGVYCDAEDVSDYLQYETPYAAGTLPTAAAVERIIAGVEDDIDDITKHAWRERRIVNEYHTWSWDPSFRRSMPTAYVELHHWQVRPFSTTAGDKLEIWTGNAYVDWLTTGKVTGRENDYFLQEYQGRIYFMRGIPRSWRYPAGVRVTYRYGEYDVPNNVAKLAVMMSARELIPMDHADHITGGGVSEAIPMSPTNIAEFLDKRIERALSDTKWIRSPRKNWHISGGPGGR